METYLVHHGIKGQKWGVRRYQNEDGTLTQLGRSRERGEASKDASSTVYRRGDGLNSSSSQRSRSNGGYSSQSKGARGSALKSNTNYKNWGTTGGRSDYLIKKGGKLSPVKQQSNASNVGFRAGSSRSRETVHEDLDGKPGRATEAAISQYEEPEDEFRLEKGKRKGENAAKSKEAAKSASQTASETIASLTKTTDKRAAAILTYKMNHVDSKYKDDIDAAKRIISHVASSLVSFLTGRNTKSDNKKHR